MVLDVNFVVYVASSETGILFTCVIRILPALRSQCLNVLVDFCKPIVSWAHCEGGVTPTSADANSKRLVNEKLPFWRLLNDHVIKHGPLPPLKLFKHGSQSFYSRMKGGVDGSAQYRATLRSSMTVYGW